MSRIRSTGNATTELRLLNLMRRHGIGGWRRNFPLIGKPDFVFPNVRVVVFVDGCFWHGHDCGRNLVPRRNAEAWIAKIAANRTRDKRVARELRKHGWGVVRVWECALRKAPRAVVGRLVRRLG